jgi:subtilisin family serine protease
MKSGLFLLLFILATACIKEEARLAGANSSDGSTGSSSSGSGGGGVVRTGTDPLASEAWHLENTGTNKGFSQSAGLQGEDINVKRVHNSLNVTGLNVRVAISDSGTDTAHPDLAGNTLSGEHRNYTFTNSYQWMNADPSPTGDEFHGTGVAGLISALGWNGIGSRGVAPESKFAAFRFVADQFNTSTSYKAKVLHQLNGNFDIFNFSYGFDGTFFLDEEEEYEAAVLYGVKTLRSGKGVLYVQASGNDFQTAYLVCDPDDPMGPGAACEIPVLGNVNSHETLTTPHKIVVGATNALGKRSSYSSPGSALWVSAPGGEYGISTPAMITTDLQGCSVGLSYRTILYPHFDFGSHPLNERCDYTNRFNGTSSAAPVATGVIALMLQANPQLTWRDVKHILASTSKRIDYDPLMNYIDHPLGADIPFYQYDYKWVKNDANYYFSNWYGFGRVDAEAAVTMAKGYDLTTLGTYEQTVDENGHWLYESGDTGTSSIESLDPDGFENTLLVSHNYIIESVQIEVNVDHDAPGELAIHLVSPRGTESRLLNINSNIYGVDLDDFRLLSNAFYGEESSGLWKIKLYDGSIEVGDGRLLNWKILINGHRKKNEINLPYPPMNINITSIPMPTTSSPPFSFTNAVSPTPILAYEVAVGTTQDPDEVSAQSWTSIGLNNTSAKITGLSLTSGQTYYLKIRARNAAGVSKVQMAPWVAN